MKVFELMEKVSKLEKGLEIKVIVFDNDQRKRIELNNEILNNKISKYSFYTITRYSTYIELCMYL